MRIEEVDGIDGSSAYVPPPPPPPPVPKPTPVPTPSSQSFQNLIDNHATPAGTPPASPQTPPSPTPEQIVLQNAQTQDTNALNKYNQDLDTLHTQQNDLHKVQASPAPMVRMGGAIRANQINQLQSQISDAQKNVDADKIALDTANANLTAAKAAQTTAQNYKPSAPQVTLSDPVTKTVNPIVTAATTKKTSAQTQVTNDTTALNQTNTDLNNLSADMDDRGLSAGKLARYNHLQKQQQDLIKQLAGDQHNLDVATAQQAAGNSVVYGQQLQADKTTLAASTTALQKAGITLDNKGSPLNPSALTSDQWTAYYNYVNAQAKVNADASVIVQSNAQLQYYASNPDKYGSIAKDGVDTVNAALKSATFVNDQGQTVYLALPPVKAIAPGQAKTNLDQANQMVAYANAAWNASSKLLAYNDASQKLAKVQASDPTNANGALTQAQADVATTKAAYDQAAGYLGTVTGQRSVQADQQAVATAKANYDASPNATNQAALTAAQKQLGQDQTALTIANANFQSGSAAVYAAIQLQNLVTAQSQLPSNVCLSPDSPLMKQVNDANAKFQSAQLVANNLGAYANKLQLDNNVTLATDDVTAKTQALSSAQTQFNTWQTANPSVPEQFNPFGSALSQAQNDLSQTQQTQKSIQMQADVGQYQLLQSEFNLTLPSNLLDPQTDQDKAAFSKARDDFFKQHPGALSDAAVANQYLSLTSPDQKVDVNKGLQELQQYYTAEESSLKNRSMLQQGADWVGGLFGNDRSDLEKTLQDDKKALLDLQAKQGQMSAADYNAAYMKIMGNLGTQYSTMSQAEQQTDSNWSTAQDVVRDVVVAGVAIGVTVLSAGTLGAPAAVLAGGIIGFGAAEGIDTAQNLTTVAEGGDINSNSHISLAAPLTNNFFHGGVTGKEWGRSAVDATVDAVTSFTSAAGTGAGIGAGASVAQTLAANGVKNALVLRASSGAAGMFVTQAIMGGGTLVSTGVQVGYQESQGDITAQQGNQQMSSALKGVLFNLITAPITGAVGGLVPNTLIAQTGVNLATNSGMTLGNDYINNQSFGANDALSIALNTLSATAMHAGGEHINKVRNTQNILNTEATVRDTFSEWIPPSTPELYKSVFLLTDPKFEDAYLAAGGTANPKDINAFINHGDDGHPTVVNLRGAASDPATLVHEFVHYYMDPAFRDFANTIVFNADEAHSNLNEGVAEFLTSQVVPDASDRPYSAEATFAKAIFDKMGPDAYRAVFQGDPTAIASFKQTALDLNSGQFTIDPTASRTVDASITPPDPQPDDTQITERLNDAKTAAQRVADDLARARTALTEAASSLADLNSDITNFTTDAVSLSSTLKGTEQALFKLDADATALKTSISDAQANYGQAAGDQSALAADLTGWQTKLAQAPDSTLLQRQQSIDTSAKDLLADLQQERRKSPDQFDLAPLKARLDALMQQQGQLDTAFAKVNLNDLDQQSTNIGQSITANGTQLRSLEGDLNSLATRQTDLQSQNDGISATLSGLQAPLSDLQGRQGVLESRIGDAQASLDAQGLVVDALKEQLPTLINELRQLRAQIPSSEGVSPETQALAAQYDNTLQQLTALQDALPGSETQLSNLRQQAAQAKAHFASTDLTSTIGSFQALPDLVRDLKQGALTTTASDLTSLTQDTSALRTTLTDLSTRSNQGDRQLQAIRDGAVDQQDNAKQLSDAESLYNWLDSNKDLTQQTATPDRPKVDVKTTMQNRLNKIMGAVVTDQVAKRTQVKDPNVVPPWIEAASKRAASVAQWHQELLGKAYDPQDYQPSQFVRDEAASFSRLSPLADMTADAKTSPAGYGRRRDRNLLALLANNVGKYGRALTSSPSQYLIGASNGMSVASSNATPAPKGIDEQYAKLYQDMVKNHPESAATIDLAIGSVDPGDASSVGHVRNMLTKFPGVFKAISITLNSAEITNMLGSKATTLDAASQNRLTNLNTLLSFAEESGLAVSIRSDVMNPSTDSDRYYVETKASQPTDYDNFDRLTGILEQHPNLNVILRQTGLSKFVTADAALHFQKLGDALTQFDAAKANANGTGSLRFDLSGDVVPTNSASIVASRFVTDPDMRTGLLNFLQAHPDAIVFGSGSLQAENVKQYRGAFSVLTPVFSDIAKLPDFTAPNGTPMTGQELLFGVLRGNYLDLMNKATTSVDAWTKSNAKLSPAALTKMDNMRSSLDALQADANAKARDLFNTTMSVFSQADSYQPFKDPQTSGQTLFDVQPRKNEPSTHSFWLGKQKHTLPPPYAEPTRAQKIRASVTGFILAGATGGVSVASERLQGLPGMKYVTLGSGALRGVIGAVTPFYTEFVRLSNEEVFELNHVTKETVGVVANRMLEVGNALGIPKARLDNAVTLIAQFGSDYTYLAQASKDNGWSEQQFQDASMALVNRFQNNLDQAFGLQATSLNVLDPGSRVSAAIGVTNLATRAIGAGSYLDTLAQPHLAAKDIDTALTNIANQGGGSIGGVAATSTGASNFRFRSTWVSRLLAGLRMSGYTASIGLTGFKGATTDVPMIADGLATQNYAKVTIGLANSLIDAANLYANAGLDYNEFRAITGKGTPHFRVTPHFAVISGLATVLGAVLSAYLQATASTPKTSPGSGPPTPTPTPSSTPTPSATPSSKSTATPTPSSTPSSKSSSTPTPSATATSTPTKTPLHAIKTGATAYPNPVVSKQTIGTFPANATLTPTGHTQKDAQGNLWYEVTGKTAQGKTATGWVQAKDVQ